MQKLINTIRVSLLYISALLLVGSYPLTAMAVTEEVPAISTTVNTPATSDSSAISSTPLPTETKTTPEASADSNNKGERQDRNKWRYNPETGRHERIQEPKSKPVQVTPPAAPATSGEPVVVTPTADQDSSPSQNVTAQQNETSILTDDTKTALTNMLNSTAKSGDAKVKDNTYAGNATTGDATATTTILNNVNSSMTNSNNQKAASFVSDITGDVYGDIILQPMLLKAMLEAGATNASNNTTVNNTNQFTNDINLNAASGNASVKDNTNAGNATTGSANTVANVMNLVNSMVSANRSFVGTVNIYGDLDGDILVAPDFIPQMLASNKDVSSSSQTSGTSTAVNVNDTQTIVNNVALAAESGKAAVLNNTNAGNAMTGDAKTNTVIFNLSGHEIIASNSLLVFVNVLGKWVGVIVDAPTGATAAAIGSGVTTNKTMAPDLTITTNNNTLITNNINLNSQSGDATVANNTNAGSATTGDATASANIGNIVGSQLGLSDWFGVLFINVFGTWHGSFGVDTAYGNPIVSDSGDASTKTGQSAVKAMKVIEFIPRNVSTDLSSYTPSPVTIISSNNDGTPPLVTESQPKAELTSATLGAKTNGGSPLSQGSPLTVDFRLPILTGSAFLAALSFAGLKRLLFARKSDAIA